MQAQVARPLKEVRTEMLDKVKKDFKALVKDEFASSRWDEKLIQEGRDFTAFERITVFSSHRNGTNCWKLSENQADAIKSILDSWKLGKHAWLCVLIPQHQTRENSPAHAYIWKHCETILCYGLSTAIICTK